MSDIKDKKITKCSIGPYPRPMPEGMFDPLPKVSVTYDDGSEEKLFTFFPDEISFSEEEFIGLTKEQAMRRRRERDIAYLRS